jgi:hypothetical protein
MTQTLFGRERFCGLSGAPGDVYKTYMRQAQRRTQKEPRRYFLGNMADTGTRTKPRAASPLAQAAMRATDTG